MLPVKIGILAPKEEKALGGVFAVGGRGVACTCKNNTLSEMLV